MIIVRNRFLPVPGFAAINLFGVLFCRRDVHITPRLVNHERIHTAQMLEMGILPFYLWYAVEWLIRRAHRKGAYFRISFEREAYRNEHNPNYLKKRHHYAWWKCM